MSLQNLKQISPNAELSNLITIAPDTLLVGSFLKDILNKISFEQLIAEIYKYPNIYDTISKMQDVWKEYYLRKYSLPKTPENQINWFYEIFSQHSIFHRRRDYLSSKYKTNLTEMIPNFTFFKEDMNQFKIISQNIFPYQDVKKYISFKNYGPLVMIGQGGYTSDIYGAYLLLQNGDLILTGSYNEVLKKGGEDSIVARNVKKIISDDIRYLSGRIIDNIFFILFEDGSALFKTGSEIFHSQYSKLPEELKLNKVMSDYSTYDLSMIDIQKVKSDNYSRVYFSSTDKYNNIYIFIVTTDSQRMDPPYQIPIEQKFKKYSVLKFTDKEVDFLILYLTMDNKILYKYLHNGQRIFSGEFITNQNNIDLIDFNVITFPYYYSNDNYEKDGREIVIQLKDNDENLYWMSLFLYERIFSRDKFESFKLKNDHKLKTKNNIKVQKIIKFHRDVTFYYYTIYMRPQPQHIILRDYIFYILDTKGNVYTKTFESEMMKPFQDYKLIYKIDNDFTEMKLFSNEGELSDIIPSHQFILRKGRNRYVLIPYPLYLEYRLNNLISKDGVFGNAILFRLKNYNYVFRTEL